MYNVMEVVLTPELSKLIVSYRELKNTQEKQTILLIIFIMTLAFSTKLSFGLLFITLCIQGVQKKMRRSFCLISLATNMLESWDIIHWKGGIHSFVWSTKTFLYDIREPRYKQIKMGYQISKCLNIGKSSVWKSDTAAIYA